MRYEAVFFDFDGTLVDSAAAKKQAFFDLFPPTERHRAIVEDVLGADPDGSRYVVIPRIVEAMRSAKLDIPSGDDVEALIREYGQAALEAVIRAPEMPDASRLLDTLRLNNVDLYLCSNTPQDAIELLLESRGWRSYFADVAGYPQVKEEFVHRLLHNKGMSPRRAAFVGDGVSDERAAKANDIVFYVIKSKGDLKEVAQRMNISLDV
jgi:phosphoglycolate phosphatase-like HAD superfamily hydrolase